MPIYAYRCESCGFAKDVLQKMSDPLLTQCPECGRDTFRKQLTAAGFQLKGSGWYATDFKGGGTSKPPVDVNAEAGKGSAKSDAEPAAAKSADAAKSTDGSSSSSASTAPAPASSSSASESSKSTATGAAPVAKTNPG